MFQALFFSIIRSAKKPNKNITRFTLRCAEAVCLTQSGRPVCLFVTDKQTSLEILLVCDLLTMFDFVEPFGVRHSVTTQYQKGVKFSILMKGFLMLLPYFHALKTLFNLVIILF